VGHGRITLRLTNVKGTSYECERWAELAKESPEIRFGISGVEPSVSATIVFAGKELACPECCTVYKIWPRTHSE
jgi:hypothetical protein